ncbi:glycine betaine ABC transporter substrate-binding protein [Thermomonospora umbrina]|uniref:glycine betaine ABC transporter substrate-binding protein n=1 Tax=Thermomonospora umbrina TaxID=111806 RepID=UPI001476D394|nr:glycine betaine ABC transporter substrate-binding protein [Thermomonospora umbrina]
MTAEDPEEIGGYRLTGRIGEGGQGVVYLASRSGTGDDPVAVKVLNGTVEGDSPMDSAEIALVRRIPRFCTARLLHAGVDGGRPYLVSEYIDAPSLLSVVESGGPLRGVELERLAVGSITALAATHAAGVVHRDVKPHNVLMAAGGPRVVDFGVAVALGPSGAGRSGRSGTPRYMAPEQAAHGTADAAADVWSWAVTMVFAAVGSRAFGDDDPSPLLGVEHHLPDLPAWLGEVVMPCLREDPARRPQSREILLRLLGYDDVPPAGPAPAPARNVFQLPRSPTVDPGRSSQGGGDTGHGHRASPATSFRRRRRVLVGGTAVALVVAVTAGLGVWLRASEPRERATAATTAPTRAPHLIVGSANFPESVLVSEIYAQALEAKGFAITRRRGIGSRETYYPLIEAGEIDLVPEYNGALASHLGAIDVEAKEPMTTGRVNDALRDGLPDGLRLLDSAKAENKDAIVVTRKTAKSHGLRSVADLEDLAAGFVLGGLPEFETRYQGLIGLRAVYHVDFKDFQPIRHEDSGTLARLLTRGSLQAGHLFTTDPRISVNGFVVLDDPEDLFGSQNVTPLVKKSVAGRVGAALDAVSAELTTDDLLYMNTRVAVNKDKVETVAKAWLVQSGLV